MGQATASVRASAWIAQAQARSLAQVPLWAVLLHHDGQQFTVPAASFLLSAPRPSLQDELAVTLRLIDEQGPTAACRYPARYLWLRAHIDLPDWQVTDCPELDEFRQRAPMDQVSLVFASESLQTPASMMGHLFLKIDGPGPDGQRLSHAIAFFTDANTINLPKLLFDSVVVGKVGHYALTPYSQEVHRYVDDEQRNLWEFDLRLDVAQRQLLQAHLIELKHSDFNYYFQKHNCATLMRFIIALGAPPLASPPRTSWDSPRSVLRRADEAGLLGETRALTPPAWQARMLAEAVPRATRTAMVDALSDGCDTTRATAAPPESALLAWSWAQAWTRWQSTSVAQTERPSWRACATRLQAQGQARWGEVSMEGGSGLNPLQAPPEAQAAIGLARRQGHWQAHAEVWALAHGLEDDHRSAQLESAQRLLGLSIRHTMGQPDWYMDQATLYEMTSLPPWDAQLGGRSSHFRLAWAPVAETPHITRHTWVAEWGPGLTWRAHRDIDVFGLMVLGTQWRNGLHLVARPVIGTIVRELGDMKTTVQIDRTWNNLGQGWGPLTVQATQSIYLGRSWSLMLNHSIQHQAPLTSRSSGATLRYLY